MNSEQIQEPANSSSLLTATMRTLSPETATEMNRDLKRAKSLLSNSSRLGAHFRSGIHSNSIQGIHRHELLPKVN